MLYGSPCYYYHCDVVFSQTHLKEECQQVKVLCPNDGCGEEITRSQLDYHLQQCQYRRQSCQWCKEEVPNNKQEVNNILIHQWVQTILAASNHCYAATMASILVFFLAKPTICTKIHIHAGFTVY